MYSGCKGRTLFFVCFTTFFVIILTLFLEKHLKKHHEFKENCLRIWHMRFKGGHFLYFLKCGYNVVMEIMVVIFFFGALIFRKLVIWSN